MGKHKIQDGHWARSIITRLPSCIAGQGAIRGAGVYTLATNATNQRFLILSKKWKWNGQYVWYFGKFSAWGHQFISLNLQCRSNYTALNYILTYQEGSTEYIGPTCCTARKQAEFNNSKSLKRCPKIAVCVSTCMSSCAILLSVGHRSCTLENSLGLFYL